RDSIAIAVDGLRAEGISVQATQDTPPVSFQQDLVRAAMSNLMSQACGLMSFYSGTPLRTSAIPGCAPIATELRVFRIQNLRVADQGAALYDAVRSACAERGTVSLQDDAGAELSAVSCTRPLAARPPWYRVGSGP